MSRPVRREVPAADVSADRDDLHARRDQFLAESAADYDAGTVDSGEVEELLAEARRLR